MPDVFRRHPHYILAATTISMIYLRFLKIITHRSRFRQKNFRFCVSCKSLDIPRAAADKQKELVTSGSTFRTENAVVRHLPSILHVCMHWACAQSHQGRTQALSQFDSSPLFPLARENCSILCSMSQVGTQADKAFIAAMNARIKEYLFLVFSLGAAMDDP